MSTTTLTDKVTKISQSKTTIPKVVRDVLDLDADDDECKWIIDMDDDGVDIRLINPDEER